MIVTKKYVCFLPMVCLLFSGACNFHVHWDKEAPSLDWDEFDAPHINKKLSKKSPLGDYSVIFWQNTKGFYTRQRLTGYVVKHGWAYAKAEKPDSLDARLYDGVVGGLVDTLFKQGGKHQSSPDWLKSGVKVYKFDFIRQTGEKDSIKVFHCAVFVSDDESSACVYPVMDDS